MPLTLERPQQFSLDQEAPAAFREPLPIPRSRLPFIDGLRGVAMLMVLFFHCWLHSIGSSVFVSVGPWQVDATLPLRCGYLGVHLFLVLSGFCLTYPLVREGTVASPLDLKRFFQRRAWRILPPYYVALALFTLLPPLERSLRSVLSAPDQTVPTVTAGQFLSHLFMVHNLSPEWQAGINPAFWSLALEWQLYMVFPLLIWGFRRWGPERTLAAVLVLTVSYRTWVYLFLDTSQEEIGFIFGYAMPGRLFEFALGMTAAVALARQRQVPSEFWLRRYLIGALLFGFLALGVTKGWSRFAPITDVLWGLMFFCIVMHAGGRSATGRGWCTSRPLVALGLISYSVYLIHEPLIQRSYAVFRTLQFSPATTLFLYELVAAPLLIGVGWLFFRAVEARSFRVRSPSASPAPR